ncbi:MAG: signal peptidase I [Candidatus Dormibacteria bacterium]
MVKVARSTPGEAEGDVARREPHPGGPPNWGHRIVATTANVLGTLVGLGLVLLFVAALFLAVVTRNNPQGVPSAFGQRTFIVLSGSMTGTFNPGDLIVDRTVTRAQAARLHRGQVISFEEVGPNGTVASVFSHRIYKVSHLLNANTQSYTTAYETKGDANPAPDHNRVLPGQVLGVYELRMPYAGYVLQALHQPLVFVLLITLPFAALVAGFARRSWIADGPAKGPYDH